MAREALQIRPSTRLALKGDDVGVVFLCHNSEDKPAVKRIADALDLDFGTKFFLDSYAIPTGEAFLPWIEKSLATASGVAIFLGSAGWGPTHLWEAERALARYRGDPDFKVLPIALPGIRLDDARRLGSGKVFQDINWADFRAGPDDLDSLAKLAAALTGRGTPQHRAPARLTPYQVRRDAERWDGSGRRDHSILYDGAQLDEARKLIASNPDYVVLDQVTPFLDAARTRQERYWRRLAASLSGIAVALLALLVVTLLEYRIAEGRRLASLSRQLAIISRDANGADRKLLTAVEAERASTTPEGLGALFDQVQAHRFLLRMVHGMGSITCATYDVGDHALLIGNEGGHLFHVDTVDKGTTEAKPIGGEAGSVTAITTDGDVAWIGRGDGRVEKVRRGMEGTDLVGPAGVRPGHDTAVRALAKQASGSLLAMGTGLGELVLLDASTGSVRWRSHESRDNPVKALAFAPAAGWVIAGTGDGRLTLVDTKSLVSEGDQPRVDGGTLALGFSGSGDLLAIAGIGRLVTFHIEAGRLRPRETFALPARLTGAAIDERGRMIALGDASGKVYLYDVADGRPRPRRLDPNGAHASPVVALAFGPDQRLYSASEDGTLAIWDLSGRSGPSSSAPSLAVEVSTVRGRDSTSLVAAHTMRGSSAVWRLDGRAWRLEVDLLDVTLAALGQNSLAPASDRTPDPGFESLDPEVSALALDGGGDRVAWSTARGAVLWRDVHEGAPTEVVDRGDGRSLEELTVSDDGRWIATILPGGSEVVIYNLADPCRSPIRVDLPASGRSLAFDGSASRLAVGLGDGRVAMLLARLDWAPVGVSGRLHDAPVGGVAFASGGQYLISWGSGGGGADRTIVVSASGDLSLVRRLASLQAGGGVLAASGDPRSNVLAAADHDGHVLLWDLSDLRYVTELDDPQRSVNSVSFHEGRLLTHADDGTFAWWELDATRLVALACAKANRTLGAEEWTELRPDDRYSPACHDEASGR